MSEYPDVKREDFKIPSGMEKKIIILALLMAILALIASSVGVVGAGQRGVLLRFGAMTGIIKNESLYF